MISDVNATLLDVVGDDQTVHEYAIKKHISIGSCMSEKVVGTNGIGTCLSMGKALSITGCEHYMKTYHDYTCSASPLRDGHGRIIGCIAAMGPLEQIQAHTLAMVTAIADVIEQEIGSMTDYEAHKQDDGAGGFEATYTFDSIIGDSPAISAVREVGENAAKSDSNVLILGESGTGKELIAQSIHNAGDRANMPFVAINCGTLPKNLVESELFGYEGGAFTGAATEGHPGKFEVADGGTIFLDEIGDMPPELQAALLRVLQTREIIRVGGNQKKKINIRIIAATNIDLLKAVRKKKFRDDLYYRLNVLSIEVPPLRKRTSDIIPLATHFIDSFNDSLGKKIKGMDDEAQNLFLQYLWPGNVRELENVIERAVNLALGNIITVKELPPSLLKPSDSSQSDSDDAVAASIHHRDYTSSKGYKMLIDALTEERGNVTKVSEVLGVPKRTLYRRIKKYNITVDDFRIL